MAGREGVVVKEGSVRQEVCMILECCGCAAREGVGGAVGMGKLPWTVAMAGEGGGGRLQGSVPLARPSTEETCREEHVSCWPFVLMVPWYTML